MWPHVIHGYLGRIYLCGSPVCPPQCTHRPRIVRRNVATGRVSVMHACKTFNTMMSGLYPPVRHPVPLFRSVLQPSSIRGLATPWTYFLHFSLSSVILTDSSTESPVHVLMLFIQAVCGLPRLRAPGIVPCIISFSGQLLCFIMM